jgi:tetratricopeptide (TPR) repeat protein
MPCLVAIVAFILYALTLNHWVRLDSLPVVAQIPGWDWIATTYTPLLDAITFPFRWLPSAWQTTAFNFLAALLAALTLGLLARTVSLLPYDRTLDERAKQRSDLALLSDRLAWLPPALAVALLGAQLTFWEHATAISPEMLDLLLLAYVVRCLAEYRVDRRNSWLYRSALVYGLAIANNYAMIPFFVCYLIAIIWVKGFDFFRFNLPLRLLGCGLAGLLLYLLLPLAALVSGQSWSDFGQFLRVMLLKQKHALLTFPPYLILLLSFTSVLPLFVRSIRWPSPAGDTAAAGASLTKFVLQLVHGLFLLAALSVFFEAEFVTWSPRQLGMGRALLPFYFLSALAASYLAGHFLVLGRQDDSRPWRRRSAVSPVIGRLMRATVVMVGLAAPVVLVVTNLPAVQRNNGEHLSELARLTLKHLPTQRTYVVGDDFYELCLAEVALRHREGNHPHVLVYTGLMTRHGYHEQLAKHYPELWFRLPDKERLPEPIEASVLSDLMTSLAVSNRVYYLHPSMGYYFEPLYGVPRGLVHQIHPLPTNSLVAPDLSPDQMAENQKFWSSAWPAVSKLASLPKAKPQELTLAAHSVSRALDYWGTIQQRQGRLEEAERSFDLAFKILPSNLPAQVNLEFNRRLRKGPLGDLDVKQALQFKAAERTLEELLLYNGPFDHPVWCFQIGQVYAQGGLFRQALAQFQRVLSLVPASVPARIWHDNMLAMIRFSLGDVQTAERLALEQQRKYPNEDSVQEILTQIYMLSGQLTNALAAVDNQLRINPNNRRALLNKAAMSIQVQAYEQAVPVLDKLLSLEPNSSAAIMNRAIANLQRGRLDEARRDYLSLRKQMPRHHAVYYGLGEIAARQKDSAEALANYELYLKYAPTNSTEYKQVEQRVHDLRSGKPRR